MSYRKELRKGLHDILFDVDFEGKAVGVNGRYVSRSFATSSAYKKFKDDIAVCTSGVLDFAGDVGLDIRLTISKARDADSILKPLFDGIELSKVIRNDNQIMRFCVEKVAKKRGEPDKILVKGYAI